MLGFLFFLSILFFIIIPYLLGSIPFGLIIAKTKHVDITKLGSGGIGATNVTRNTSGKLGALTLFFDFIKGYIAVLFSVLIFHLLVVYNQQFFSHLFTIAYISSFFAILGHCFSIFIKFKGGKGVGTSGGVILAISPSLFLVVSVILIIIFLGFKIVSLSSLIAAGFVGTLCFIPWLNYYYLQLINEHYVYFHNILELSTLTYFNVLGSSIILFLSMVLVIIKHKQNITRLLKKKERIFQVGKDDLNQENINKHQKEIRNEK